MNLILNIDYVFYRFFLTAYVTQLAKVSDTQAIGCGFKPYLDHYNRYQNII